MYYVFYINHKLWKHTRFHFLWRNRWRRYNGMWFSRCSIEVGSFFDSLPSLHQYYLNRIWIEALSEFQGNSDLCLLIFENVNRKDQMVTSIYPCEPWVEYSDSIEIFLLLYYFLNFTVSPIPINIFVINITYSIYWNNDNLAQIIWFRTYTKIYS